MAQTRHLSPSRRVAVIAHSAEMLVVRRGPLLRAIAAAGHQLTCITAPAGEAERKYFETLGIEHAAVDWNGDKLSLLGDRATSAALSDILTGRRPTAALTFGYKPSVLLAKLRRRIDLARHVAVLPLLPALSDRSTLAARWVTRRSLASVDAVIVYSSEARDALSAADQLRAGCPVTVMAGGGVDLSAVRAMPLPDLEQGMVFTMISDDAGSNRGILDFCAAAQRVKVKAPGARFVLAVRHAAAVDPLSGETVAAADIGAFSGAVEVVAAPFDTLALLAASHVFVHPARAESFAHGVAQALAVGRPAITTAIAGCRDLVDERVSGVLVPPADVMALAGAIEGFLRRPDLIPWMAQASRHKAERRFDCAPVNSELMRLMELSARAAA